MMSKAHILDSIFLRRDDQEYSQSLARIAISGLATLVLVFALFQENDRDIIMMLWTTGSYLVFAVVWAIMVRRKSGKFPARRCMTIVGDNIATSVVIYFGGNVGAAFYPLYFWIFVGNGIRFGLNYLYFAMFVALPCFGCIVFLGDFWNEVYPLGIGLLAGIGILPLFYAMLLRQIHHLNEELSNELAKADYAAKHDALTGLPNRPHFFSVVKKHINRPPSSYLEFAVILIDLDGFKKVNDTFGHDSGDALLLEVATRLEKALRKGDMAARLGGDEFAIIMPGIMNRGAGLDGILQRLLTEVSEVSRGFEGGFQISASIGVSFYPDHGDSPEVLIKQADLAMYEAKRMGKNRWVFFSYALCDKEVVRR
jgi:diguanylate cyclase (GGDEF)-like protein